MEESLSTLTSIIVNNVLAPLLLVVGSTVLVVVKKYADKVVNSIVSKNDTETLERVTSTRSQILEEIDFVVDGAVASNMQLAEELKSQKKKLTPEDVKLLNRTAIQLIYDSLPDSLTNENGTLSKIIGGKERLTSIIDGLIEKHVNDQKIEKEAARHGNIIR